MKKFLIFFFISFIFVSFSFADNIIMKNGTKIMNIKILKKDKSWVYYQMSNGFKSKTSIKGILKIEKTPFNEKIKTKIIPPKIEKMIPNNEAQKYSGYHYPNFKLITISLIAFTLSYDYFSEANNIQKAIDFNNFSKNLTPDINMKNQYSNFINDLKNQKQRKIIMGSIFLTCGIINTIIALKNVQIKASPQSLSLSYKF